MENVKELYREQLYALAETVFNSLEEGDSPYGSNGMGLEYNDENARLVFKFWVAYKKGNKKEAVELFENPLRACLEGVGITEDDDSWC